MQEGSRKTGKLYSRWKALVHVGCDEVGGIHSAEVSFSETLQLQAWPLTFGPSEACNWGAPTMSKQKQMNE